MRSALLTVAVFGCVVTASAGSAQTSSVPSATLRPAAPATPGWCPVSARVRELDSAHTLYAVSVRAFETAPTSGVVALWAGDRRYDVAFHNLVALDMRDRTNPDTALVVRFGTPTALDGAVVTSIEEGGIRRPCEPWFAPWAARKRLDLSRLTPEQRHLEDQILAGARAAVVVDAPAAISDPKPCAGPDSGALTLRAVEPDTPRFAGNGVSVIMVLLDTSDNVMATRILRSAGNARLDNAALTAARASTFQGETFRCRDVIGLYLFTVEFRS